MTRLILALAIGLLSVTAGYSHSGLGRLHGSDARGWRRYDHWQHHWTEAPRPWNGERPRRYDWQHGTTHDRHKWD